MKKYYCFIDESGTEKEFSLDEYEKNKALDRFLTITAVIYEKSFYKNFVIPCVKEIKVKHFNDENIIFHSTDIRNKKKEFEIFKNEDLYTDFKQDMKKLIEKTEKAKYSSSTLSPGGF